MTVTILEPMGNTEISVDMFDPFGWVDSWPRCNVVGFRYGLGIFPGIQVRNCLPRRAAQSGNTHQ